MLAVIGSQTSTTIVRSFPKNSCIAIPRPDLCYRWMMSTIRARVQNGRLQVDQPTGLPEGTVLDLVVDDEGDDLDETERAALNESIARASIEAGRGRLMREVLEDLRRRRQSQ